MAELIHFLNALTTIEKFLWLATCLSILTLFEFIIPFDKKHYDRSQHFKTNGALLVSTLTINAIFSVLLIIVTERLVNYNFGLLHLVDIPLWVQLIVTLLLLDLLAQYLIHYLLHMVPFMWRFHQVHHSDTHVDATTGTRHHPIDYIFREIFSLMTLVLLGAPLAFYLFYRMTTIFFTYFTHANIQLPHNIDKALSFIVVTPKAHKFHHHFQAPWTDMNFGNIFVFWDKLFKTWVYQSTDDIQYGVDTMLDEESNNLMYQLHHPFNKQLSK